jgi:hypothetical protein
MRDGEPLVMRPRYCGMPHRATDGLPVAHACRVLPADAIRAEFRGHTDLALRLFASEAAAGRLPQHPGLWKHRRR